MVLYLVFNLLCCVCSMVVVSLCAIVLLLWVSVDEMLQGGQCLSQEMAFKPLCRCSGDFDTFKVTLCELILDKKSSRS